MNKRGWDDMWMALGMVFVMLLSVTTLVGAIGGIWFLCTLD